VTNSDTKHNIEIRLKNHFSIPSVRIKCCKNFSCPRKYRRRLSSKPQMI